MRSLPPSCALLLGALLPAQETSPAPSNPPPAAATATAELVAAKARLQGALQKCGALADTAFQTAWGPDTTKKKANDGLAAFAALSAGGAKGSWHADRLHVAYDGDAADELIVAGRRALAKADGADWRVRTGRFADGNKLDFVPDPALLLQLLARWDLAVTQRTVGSLDDRPVEIVSVTLSADQVAEAVWSGALPEALTQVGFSGGVFRLPAAGGGNAQRQAPPAPESTIDLAIHLDPATNLVHQVHVRGWTKADGVMRAGAPGNVVFVQGGAVLRGANRGAADDEEEDAVEPAKDGPLTYTDGLPVRPRKKQSVYDYTIRLREHGKRQAPALTAAQQQLLGR